MSCGSLMMAGVGMFWLACLLAMRHPEPRITPGKRCLLILRYLCSVVTLNEANGYILPNNRTVVRIWNKNGTTPSLPHKVPSPGSSIKLRPTVGK